MLSHPHIVAVVGVGEMKEGRATPAHSSLVYVANSDERKVGVRWA